MSVCASCSKAKYPSHHLIAVRSGQDSNIAFMAYGQRWRRHRQAFTREFTPRVNPTHLTNQRESAHLFLRSLLKEPENLCEHMR